MEQVIQRAGAMYCIENAGEADPESFVLLGASASRDNEESIGQFGSGAKHAILTCIRHGIRFRVFCGITEVEFRATPTKVNGKEFQLLEWRTVDSQSASHWHKTSYVTEFGALDWTDATMGLREFIANALDAVNLDPSKVFIGLASPDEIAGAEGKTRVFVERVTGLSDYIERLPVNFLHFDPERAQYSTNEGAAVGAGLSADIRPGRVYYRGVLSGDTRKPALLDYFFRAASKNIVLTESRVFPSHAVSRAASYILCECKDKGVVSIIVKAICNNRIINYAEFSYLSDGAFSLFCNGTVKQAYCDEFKEQHADTWIAHTGQLGPIYDAKLKGIKTLVVDVNVYDICLTMGLPTITKCPAISASGKGHIGKPLNLNSADEREAEDAAKTWDIAEEIREQIELNISPEFKTLPAIFIFDAPGDGLCGYAENGRIWLEREHRHNPQTIMEELLHAATGAVDCSRGFQEIICRLAVSQLARASYAVSKLYQLDNSMKQLVTTKGAK